VNGNKVGTWGCDEVEPEEEEESEEEIRESTPRNSGPQPPSLAE
jgi:hypothetical protein